MSYKLDQRAHGQQGLLRRLRSFVCGYPLESEIQIKQNGAGSVGAGEIFFASGPTAKTGRLRLTCTIAGGDGVAQFSLAYTTSGSPPTPGSPTPSYSGSTLIAGQQFQRNDTWIRVSTSVNWAVGNLIDIDISPTTNTTPWLEKRWIDNQNNSPNFSGELEWIVSGPGATSPRKNITMGVQTQTLAGSNRFNWRCNYFDAFIDTSPMTVYASQPNISPDVFIHFNQQPLDYHVTINNRRFMFAAELSSGVWQAGYFGFILPYAGDASYPYPIAVGGSSRDGTFNFTTVSVKHSSFWDPGATFPSTDDGALVLRNPVSAHQSFHNKTDGSAEPGEFAATAIDNVVWPWGSSHQNANVSAIESRTFWDQMARTPRYQLGTSPDPLLRAYVPFQSVLFSVDFAGGVAQAIGFLDGVFWVTGESNAGGNTFVLESPERTYLLVQNAFRGTPISYAAFRLDP